MLQAIVIFGTLAIAKQITKRIDCIQSIGLKIALEILLRSSIVGLSICLKMEWMIFINGLILFFIVIGIRSSLQQLKMKQEEAEEEDKRDGVAYTLTENEYKIID